jgi:hypothetical protein
MSIYKDIDYENVGKVNQLQKHQIIIHSEQCMRMK